MKILITGANGMVGRNISKHPAITKNTLLTPSSKELDLTQFTEVEKYLETHSPEIIIHCAGKVGGIQANISEPVDFLIKNLDIGRNIVLGAKQAGIKKLINMSSSCMYPHDAKNPLKEEYILRGELEQTNEGYALAKITTSKLCEYINREDSSFQYKTLIPCNLYGKYDKFSEKNSHMIPAVIKKTIEAIKHKNSVIEIWGDGKARREFMYAGDLASFVSNALDNYNNLPSLMNVGLGYDYSISEYYQTIADILGFKGEFVHDLSKPIGMKQKLIDTQKLSQYGWKSKTSLTEGLAKTIEYYNNMEHLHE